MRGASKGGAALFGFVLCAVTITMVAAPARAQVACGSDVDGDGVCDDVDNCPSVANAGQENTYGGPAGDACEHMLNVVKLKIKTGTSTTPKGKISAKGDFILGTGEDFTAAANLTIRVIDGLDIDVTAPASTPSNPDGIICTAIPGRIRCRGTVPSSSLVFKIGPANAEGARLVSWSAKIAKLATSQIPQEPVTVIITDEAQGLAFGGDIHDCFPRNGKLTCKEF
jgi:hypothetical protein